MKTKRIIGSALAAAAILLTSIFLACSSAPKTKTVDAGKFLTVDFSGYDSFGNVIGRFDSNALYDAIDEALPKDNSKEFDKLVDYIYELAPYGRPYDPAEESKFLIVLGKMYGREDVVSQIVNKITSQEVYATDRAVSNGDKIALNWKNLDEINDTYGEFLGFTLKSSLKEVEVSGLKEVVVFDPFDGLNIKFDGYDTIGTCTIDNGSISDIRFEIDNTSNLSNGDKVTVRAVVPQNYTETTGKKASETEKTFTVEGLAEIEKVDVFAKAEVEFDGTSPDGTALLRYSGEWNYALNLDKTTGLKNGDVVTVSIDEYTIDEYIRSCGKAPMEKTKQYTVEGLDEYYKNVNEISDEALERLLAEAMDVAKANLSSNYDPATVYNLEAMELYVLSEKTSEGGRKTHNKIVVCFDQNGTCKFTHWGGTAYTGTFKLYYGICFDNVSFDKDGKLVESSLRDYKADNNWATLKANSDDGKGGTSDYRALGYATVNEFIAKLVDPYRADYSVTSKVLENSNE